MRFMMLMIPGIYQDDRAASLGEGFAPDPEMVAKMMKYNEDLSNAGLLLGLDGLQPPSLGARVQFANGKPAVTDGPFIETKEVVGGYWMIKAASKEEAIEWASRCPAQDGDAIEIRPVFEMPEL